MPTPPITTEDIQEAIDHRDWPEYGPYPEPPDPGFWTPPEPTSYRYGHGPYGDGEYGG